MKTTVFIDGSAGTTGLRIRERLSGREDITLLTLPEEQRKDPASRREMLNKAGIAFLCLPDAAAVEAVALIDNPRTIIIDTSTAHRTAPGWVYGFPELSGSIESALPDAMRIAVPGCHASGFLALIAPLVAAGALSPDSRLCCHSLTGYSGGGKNMIAAYETAERDTLLDTPRQYGLGQQHKHLREMQAVAGLTRAPIFCPIVADYYSGMEVTVPLFREELMPGFDAESLKKIYRQKYTGSVVHYTENAAEDGFMAAGKYSGKDSMEITVCGNNDRLLLIARYDNLGKGASGAAVECLNIRLGQEKTLGLAL